MNIEKYGSVLRETILYNIEVIRQGGRREDFIVPMAWSEPGIGKTETQRGVVASLGNAGWDLFADQGATASSRWAYHDIDLQTRDSAELGGNPWVVEGRSIRCRPDWMTLDCMTVLALDEFAQAPLANLNIAGTLLREGRVGEHALPLGCMLVGASNPAGSRTGTSALPGQVRSRMVHWTIDPDAMVWANYAVRRNIDPLIIAYNKVRTEYHHKYDPAALSYPCGRSWEMANALMRMRLEEEQLAEGLAGCVGATAAHDFLAFRHAAASIPDIGMILRDPMNAALPSGLDITFVTLQALAYRADAANLSAIVRYLQRLPEPEFATACMTDAVARNPDLEMTGAYAAWSAAVGNDLSRKAA